jgi:hypothetical protein
MITLEPKVLDGLYRIVDGDMWIIELPPMPPYLFVGEKKQARAVGKYLLTLMKEDWKKKYGYSDDYFNGTAGGFIRPFDDRLKIREIDPKIIYPYGGD